MLPDALADTTTDRSFLVTLLGEAGIVFTVALLGELGIKALLDTSGTSLSYLDWFSVVAVFVFVTYRLMSTALGADREPS